MKVHLLTGDSLYMSFNQTGIEGNLLISRECLIAGEVAGSKLAELWQTRAKYIHDTYGKPIENNTS